MRYIPDSISDLSLMALAGVFIAGVVLYFFSSAVTRLIREHRDSTSTNTDLNRIAGFVGPRVGRVRATTTHSTPQELEEVVGIARSVRIMAAQIATSASADAQRSGMLYDDVVHCAGTEARLLSLLPTAWEELQQDGSP